MRKITLFLITVVTIAACKKKEDKTLVSPPVENPVIPEVIDTSYYLSGIKDIHAYPIGSFSMEFSGVHTDGIQRKLNLSLTGLPDKAEANFTMQTGFTPFSDKIDITTKFLSPGTYPISITSTPDKGEVKTYDVNLRVASMNTKDCDQLFLDAQPPNTVGNTIRCYDTNGNALDYSPYLQFNPTTGELNLSRVILSYDATNPIRSYLSLFNVTLDNNKPVRLKVDCNDGGKLIIPEQVVTGYRAIQADTIEFNISGSGNINIDNRTWNITYTTDSSTFKLQGGFTK